jgi:hypothetical protein
MWLAWACPGCVVVFGLLAALVPALFALYFHRRAAHLADMRPTHVAALSPGPRKIKARVVAQEPLLSSPMERRPCVYYRFVVAERQQISGPVSYGGGRYGAGPAMAWVNVVDDVEAINVLLEDDTGQVDVNLYEAEIVGKSAEKTSSVFEDPPERLKRLLRDRYGKSTRGLLFNKTMSFTETVLADGARVVVVGEVKDGRNGLELRRGSVPLIVSDKGRKGLGAPYHRKAMYCWIGVGLVLVPTVVLSIIFGLLGADLAQNAASAQQTNPPPAPQPNGPQAPANQKPDPVPPGNPAKPPDDAIRQLAADLRAPDPAKRKAAAEKLAAIPVDEARRAEVKRGLEAILKEADPETAPAALKALQTWGDEGSVPQLQMLFVIRDAPYHEQVIRMLAKFPSAQSLGTLADGLADARDRPVICDALREVGIAAEPIVLQRLAVTMDPDEKGDICFLLADIGGPASETALQRLAKDLDPKVAIKAALALNLLRQRPHDK